MTLTCSCGDHELEPGEIYWYGPADFSTYNKVRATRCCSCGARIINGDLVGRFHRVKIPNHDVEISIYGEDGEIPRASWYHCEECAGLYMSLTDLGFCVDIRHDDMHDLVKEYAAMNKPAESSHD